MKAGLLFRIFSYQWIRSVGCWVVSASLLFLGTYTTFAWSQEPQTQLPITNTTSQLPQRWIEKAWFNGQTSELTIEQRDKFPLEAINIDQSPSKKQISFFIPQAAVQPSPNMIAVPPDPIIRSIKLEQRALAGTPAVKVEIDLYSSSPYIPFALIPQPQGLTIMVGRPPAPIHPLPTPNPTDPKQPPEGEKQPTSNPANRITLPEAHNHEFPPSFQWASYTATTISPSLKAIPDTMVFAEPQSTTIALPVLSTNPAPASKTIETKSTTPAKKTTTTTHSEKSDVKTYKSSSQSAKNTPAPPASLAPKANLDTKIIPGSPKSSATSSVGTPSAGPVSTIDDIYFDNNVLKISSNRDPLIVKRSFSLFEPARFVLDISPAQLAPTWLQRAIAENNANIMTIRASQFEKDTVRFVIQFQKNQPPAGVTQSANKKTVRLSF